MEHYLDLHPSSLSSSISSSASFEIVDTMVFTQYILRADAHQVSIRNPNTLRGLDISFKQTVRVPDNNEASHLPPNLGEFPLYKVQNYANKLPQNMVEKGGVFYLSIASTRMLHTKYKLTTFCRKRGIMDIL